MRRWRPAAPLALMLIVAACGKGDDVASAPSLEGPSTHTTQSPAPGTRIPLSTGNAKMHVSGGISGTYTLGTMIPASFVAPSEGAVTVGWQDADLNGIGLVGDASRGRIRTSASTGLNITAGCGAETGCRHFHSEQGECAVTIIELETDGTVGGRFTCTDIEGIGDDVGTTIDADGTFSASP